MVETYRAGEAERRTFRERTEPADRPSLAVVVPVYDEPEEIRRTVASVAASDYEPLAIHVVYTPADGATGAALADLSADLAALSVHEEATHETPGAARNVGVDAVDADVVCFLDADMTVEDGFFWTVGRVFGTERVDYLGFPVEMRTGDCDRTVAGWYDEHVRFPNRTHLEEHAFCPTCCLAVHTGVFEDGLRFDPTLVSGEDVAFGRRVAAAGYDRGFCPDATATHPIRNSLEAVVRKGIKTGRGYRQMEVQYGPGPGGRYLGSRGAWVPESPSTVATKCRDWEGLSVPRKGVLWGMAYVERLAQTAGFVREALEPSTADPPSVERAEAGTRD